MDIAMVVPTKANVGEDNYATMIRSVEDLIKQFSLLNGSSHIAIVQFANEAKVRYNISDLSNPTKLRKVIKAMHNNNDDLGKDMHTYNALKVVSRKVFKDGRDNALGQLMSFFFSRTNQPMITKPIRLKRYLLHFHRKCILYFTQGKGIYRVVVNMGNEITEKERKVIAGGTEGVFQAGSFDGLEAKTNDIHNRTCKMLNCEDPPLDICLVIDQTESVKVENYKLMIEFVDNFTHFFVIGENKTRFAIITFAKEPSVRINFSSVDYQNQQKLSELFKNMMNDKLSSPTRTDRALAMAGNEVFNEANGDRPHAPDALIVLTDGKTHDDSEPFETVLKPIEEKNVHRIAVGIGTKMLHFRWQLVKIAGDDHGVITVTDFKELSKQLRRLREVTCSIDGGYSKWSSWSECSASCDGGVRWRNRTCTKPEPRHRGRDCTHLGPSEESEACNTIECGFPTPKPPQCMAALGMQSGKIPDSSITASSSYNAVSFAPSIGRLFLSAGSGNYGSWAAEANNENQWFQVDFGSWTKISAVATQGRQDWDQWVESYWLSFSYDGVFSETVNDDGGSKQIFTGNSDRNTVVRNQLDNPVITQYIRIHPKTWKNHISMRTEFYGCKEGFDPPKLVCRDALGMQSGEIPDSALKSSSAWDQYWGPERSRLNEQQEGSYYGGWQPKTADARQWLQIDLGKITKVTRIATQGRSDYNYWVTKYTLTYSDDEGEFKSYKSGEEIEGNTDRNTPAGRILDEPIIARFIRIHPKTWNEYITMRVELFGCREGLPTPKPPQCMDALGMQSGKIPDSSITASSSYNAVSFAPSIGRLFLSAGSGHTIRDSEVRDSRDDENQWFQVDFGSWTKISAVATQGRQDWDQWVESYWLSFSYDGVFSETVNDDGGSKQIFTGNSDRNTVVRNQLDNPVITQYIRIHPKTWKNHISMRTEFYGCKEGFDPPKLVCRDALGMQSGEIPDSALKSSSAWDKYWGPERSRLNEQQEGSYFGGWQPKTSDARQWLQIDLGKVTKVTRIATQGRSDYNYWVTKYTLTYSDDEGEFKSYKSGEEIEGNTDRNTPAGRILDEPIIARFIRIHPKTWHAYITMRVELFGCREVDDGFSNWSDWGPCSVTCGGGTHKRVRTCTNPPPQNGGKDCEGLKEMSQKCSSNECPTAIEACSNYIPHSCSVSLLFVVDGRYTSRVNARRHAILAAVKGSAAAQIHHHKTAGKIAQVWENLQKQNGATEEIHSSAKIFATNNDRNSIVKYDLIPPITAKYIRIIPESWYAYIALRVEFYGCAANNGGYSQWGDWTKCSVTCGTGQRSRSRTCTNPPPSSGGKDCSGLGPDKETGECDSGGCPVNGGYSDWAPYDKCSKTCGGGVQTRKRTCTNPPPASSGKDCSGLGPDTYTRECNTIECPKKTLTPVGCYENRGRALADILFKPKRFAKIPKKYEQGKAQADKKGVTVFGLDDSKCWTGQNAASSYDMYGLAKGKCGNTRKGLRYGFVASGTIFVYQKEGGVWKPLDCFNNVSPQDAFALPESFDNKVSSVTGPDAIFDYCKEKAEALGYKMFGADDKSCWSGKDAESTYNKYGESSGCTFSKKTGVWKPLDCFNNVSSQDAFALPESFDNKVSSVTGPDAIFDYCKEKAEALGYKMFGADDKSCWSGKDAESTYNKYGESSGCTFSKKTGHGSGQDKNGDVFVYKLE
ncbi:hypothetical protein ACROYT_G036947 [Oculina patagonica]